MVSSLNRPTKSTHTLLEDKSLQVSPFSYDTDFWRIFSVTSKGPTMEVLLEGQQTPLTTYSPQCEAVVRISSKITQVDNLQF